MKPTQKTTVFRGAKEWEGGESLNTFIKNVTLCHFLSYSEEFLLLFSQNHLYSLLGTEAVTRRGRESHDIPVFLPFWDFDFWVNCQTHQLLPDTLLMLEDSRQEATGFGDGVMQNVLIISENLNA